MLAASPPKSQLAGCRTQLELMARLSQGAKLLLDMPVELMGSLAPHIKIDGRKHRAILPLTPRSSRRRRATTCICSWRCPRRAMTLQ
jgi:hypothetical protein